MNATCKYISHLYISNIQCDNTYVRQQVIIIKDVTFTPTVTLHTGGVKVIKFTYDTCGQQCGTGMRLNNACTRLNIHLMCGEMYILI
jgi:hypothetical protein